MKRTIETWRNCEPRAMATEQSVEARVFAYQDMRADILELHGERYRLQEQVATDTAEIHRLRGQLGVLCDLLKEAEGPLLVAKADADSAGEDDDVQMLRALLKSMRDARHACL